MILNDEIDTPDSPYEKRKTIYILQSTVRPDILMAVYDNLEDALFDKEQSAKTNRPMRIVKRLVNNLKELRGD